MQGVILAAGRGTRLGKLTRSRSKAMQHVMGVPIVECVMKLLQSQGVEEFLIVSHPADLSLSDHFIVGALKSYNVRLLKQSQPLGTAHALRCAAPYIYGDFILSACDNLVRKEDLKQMLMLWHSDPRLEGLLALMETTSDQVRSSAEVFFEDHRVRRIVEKPATHQIQSQTISLPLYCFTTQILNEIENVGLSPRGEYELPEAIQMLIDRNTRVGGIFFTHRLTLTNPRDLLTIHKYYFDHCEIPSGLAAEEMGSGTNILPPSFIEKGTLIGDDCQIGPYAYIESGCKVGHGCVFRNAVLLSGVELPAGTIIDGDVVSE